MAKVKKEKQPESLLTPRENFRLMGHQNEERALLEAFYSGRLPHAWLFSGQKGIGKATLAHRFARFLLTQTAGADSLFNAPATTLVCGEDTPAVRRILSGSHGDLLVLEAGEKDISVEEARSIGKFLRLTAAEAPYRVVIIDSIDNMNRNAANAILKLLEEPPSHAVLLLISHNPGKLLPTIRSRCRKLAMEPLAKDDFVRVLDLLDQGISVSEAEALYPVANGSPGIACDIHLHGGLDYYAKILNVLRDFPTLDIPSIHQLGDALSGKAAAEDWRIVSFLWHYFLYRLTTQGHIEEIAPGEAQVLECLRAKSSVANWLDLWEKIRGSLEDVERIHLNKKQVLGNIFQLLAAGR